MVRNCIIGICYNGNSLFLLWKFATAKNMQLNCYVPAALIPLAKLIGIKVRVISYRDILTKIAVELTLFRKPLLILPHTGGRFLKVLRGVLRTRVFVDDGFLCLGNDTFLKKNDTVITFSENAAFRDGNNFPSQYVTPASLLDYASAIKSMPAPRLTQATQIIVSSSELDNVALEALVNHPPTDVDMKYIPHPRVYKDHPLLQSLKPLHPSVAFGAESIILNNLEMINGITIGRSFTSYLLVAWLITQGKLDIIHIHQPSNCTKYFSELHRFCRWLILRKKQLA